MLDLTWLERLKAIETSAGCAGLYLLAVTAAVLVRCIEQVSLLGHQLIVHGHGDVRNGSKSAAGYDQF